MPDFPNTIIKPAMCPACGKQFDYALYPEIRIPGDSKIKKKVLNKTLFFPKCPFCGHEFKLKASCVYRNDDKHEFFIVTESPDDELEKMLKTGSRGSGNILSDEDMSAFCAGLFKRRIVHDVDAFREKILLSDSNYDDRIIELMKFSVSGLLERENRMPVYRIFLDETSGNQLEFTAIMGSAPPFEYVTVNAPIKAYNDYKEKYLDKLGRPESDEYISTDQNWARKSGLLDEEDPGFVIPL